MIKQALDRKYFIIFWPAASATGEDVPPYTYRFGADRQAAFGNYEFIRAAMDHGEQGAQLWVNTNGVEKMISEAGNV